MAQKTLFDKVIPRREPFTRLTPNEKIIYNFLNGMGRGYTHDQIRIALASTGISTFDNRLRALRQKGWVESHQDRSGFILFYAVKVEGST